MSSPGQSIEDVNANDVVAFFVELLVLALLAWAGFTADGVLGWVLGLGLPVVAAVLWGLFAAPRARISSFALQLATKVLVLGAGVAAGFVVLPLWPALVVAVVVVLNLVLMYVGPFARDHPAQLTRLGRPGSAASGRRR